jgi:hypothetical protein
MATYIIKPGAESGFLVQIGFGVAGIKPDTRHFETKSEAERWVTSLRDEDAKRRARPDRPRCVPDPGCC